MMKLLKWLDDYFEISICIVLMSFMTLLLFVQVIMRRVFSQSLYWSEELARYVFIWLIYLGISYGAKIVKHIRIEAFLNVFPRKLRPCIVILGDVLFLGFAFFIIFTSSDLVKKQLLLKQESPAIHMPMAVIYVAPLVGFVLTAVRQIQTIIFRIKELRKGAAHG
ncbi:MAG: TRAP transporter small permease [Treponema sp.]|jgi:TRAP-type C4-dicarboxylate transport system permease small subunit|nr:TRAP transporter small permease [Treponema sp.]